MTINKSNNNMYSIYFLAIVFPLCQTNHVFCAKKTSDKQHARTEITWKFKLVKIQNLQQLTILPVVFSHCQMKRLIKAMRSAEHMPKC